MYIHPLYPHGIPISCPEKKVILRLWRNIRSMQQRYPDGRRAISRTCGESKATIDGWLLYIDKYIYILYIYIR